MSIPIEIPKSRILFLLPVLFSGIYCAKALNATDWPQYRGPNLDGTTPETIELIHWPPEGPKKLWKVETPTGFSSFTVSQGKVFTLVGRPDQDGIQREVCIALDAETGREMWSRFLGFAKYDGGGDSGTPDNRGGDGPRSTPSISGNRVYVLDSRLGFYCFDVDTGNPVWKIDLIKEFEGRNIRWQSAASPVVDGDLVFVPGGGPGQSFIAFNKETGKVVWKNEDELMTHATPVVATIHGVRQIIFFAQSGLVSLETRTGRELWRFPFPYKISTAASPVVYKDLVYCSAGYGIGAGLCRIVKDANGFKAEQVWRKKNDLINHWSTPVCKDGYLYGMFSFKQFGQGPLKCVELETGKEMWSVDGFGPGNVILAANVLVALADNGEVVLVEPTQQGYHELARTKAVKGKCWSTPTLSEGRLYVRSTVEGVCLDVSGQATE